MTDDHETLAIEGIHFFGEMCASVSHEIKNVLAIINENAGLLQDMIGMHEKGSPLSLERLSRLAQSISRQVSRGDGIVKGMNRFAHSADDARGQVDAGEIVHLITQLAGRLIGMQGQAPRIETPDTPVTLTTNRFFLQDLVWRCLCRALAACPAGGTVLIRVEKVNDCTRIRFCGLDPLALGRLEGFPSSRESAAADLITARLAIDNETCEICIIIS